MEKSQYDERTIGPEAKSKARTKFFIDRIEDNGVAVLIGPDGKKLNLPADKSWSEGQYLDPSAVQPKQGAGFYGGAQTDPYMNVGKRKADATKGQFLDNHEPTPPGMSGIHLQAPGAGIVPEEAGGTMKGHGPMPETASPWDWYPGGPVPNPTPPMRAAMDQAGPSPPIGRAGAPGKIDPQFYGRPDPARLGGEPDPILRAFPGRPTEMMSPAATARSNEDDYYGPPMSSSRGRAKNRRRRAVP